MIVPKIDLHAHVVPTPEYARVDGGRFVTPEQIRKMYDELGVEKGVQLPIASPEFECDLLTNKEARLLVESVPETVGYWFCNIDPRWGTNRPDCDLSHFLNFFKSLGAKGVGEVTANLYIDDPYMENLFYHCEKCDMPLLFHMGSAGGGDYGIIDDLGFPRLEKALQKYPNLQFIGHSQKWWAEMSGDCTEEERYGYPSGKIVPGGRTVELLRKYPNMTGDLSAGSGGNAIMRDPEFGYQFLEEFQDKLYFGIDICDASNVMPLSHWLDDAVENGHISQTAYNKICRENALKLLNR